ncbi:unnamed protein product [Kuraishia capsulata CBS 1993]|uniref:Amino acid permease/ SLC12A domain-containing protein n=1 Tax=Kuraishia capsulata CBS 1993 TaxID=1382522 RepID=W6MP57_9ASCO|nr:uncharacterized protein KUCA_T00004024001 [Kuraishia capsulata CBS 1993]CDK28043.1 unnamed protein product [Kuraishia capsulata CBS 1993]
MSIEKTKFEVSVDAEVGSISSPEAHGETDKLRVQFSTLSLISLGFGIACTWAGYGSSVGATYLYGGAPAVVWTLPIACLYLGLVAVGMAELASAYPSSGGQYHWTYMVSPDNCKVFLSYLCGWMMTVASWFAGCSLSQICAGYTFNMASVGNPDFAATQWQLYLLYVLYYFMATAVNVFASKWLSHVNNVIMACSIIGLLVSFLAILICHKAGFRSNDFVWTDYVNSTGWSSDGLAFLLAIGNACFSLLGADGASHLTDEIDQPAKKVPIAMIVPSFMGFITAWPFCIAFAYVTKDLASVMNSSFPITEVYYTATGNASLTIFIAFMNMISMFGGLIGSLQAFSRSTAALARDGGMPFPHFFGRVNSTWRVPINAMFLEGAFVVLYGLAQLGSSVAFSAAVNSLCLFLMISYCFPQAILLVRGRSILPERYLDLGFYFGYFVNATSVVLTALFGVLFCYPSYKDITLQNMNWVSVTAVGVIVILMVGWFCGLNKTFKGPAVDLEKIKFLREEGVLLK